MAEPSSRDCLTTHVLLSEGEKPARRAAVRLAWNLYWKYLKKDEAVPQDLKAWSRVLRLQEVPLARDGSVSLVYLTDRAEGNVVKLEYQDVRKGKLTLTLDFEGQTQTAKEWRDIIRFMITPWEELLDESRAMLQARMSEIVPVNAAPLDSALVAEQRGKKLGKWLEGLTSSNQVCGDVALFARNVAEVLKVSQSLFEVGTHLSVVGAGFQVVLLGMSCAGRLFSLKGEKKLEHDIREKMSYIAGRTLGAMISVAEGGDGVLEHLEALSRFMNEVELVFRRLEGYVVSHLFHKLLPGEGEVLPKMLEEVEELEKKMLMVQAWGHSVQILRGQERDRESDKRVNDKLDKAIEKLDILCDDIEYRDQSSKQHDFWNCDYSTVPQKASFVVDDAVPSVAKLRNAVLDRSQRGVVAAVGVQGSGGVGKTTACITIANDAAVRAQFEDGVLWMGLGMDSTAEDVVVQLAAIAVSSGGKSIEKEIRRAGSRNIEIAVGRARSWFEGRKVLVIVDNVWPRREGEDGRDWISLLSGIVGSEGCLLFSTRSIEIATGVDVESVEFGTIRDDLSAIAIFEKHLGIEEGSEKYSKDVRDRVLAVCGGLPLALSTAGRLLRLLDYQWVKIDKELTEALMKAKSDADTGRHPGLASTIALTLGKLERNELGGWAISMTDIGGFKYSWSSMYYALCVLPKSSTSIPVEMLRILWEVDGMQAERVVRVLCDLGLASMESKKVVSLHDLQWEYCRYQCSCTEGLNEAFWHERLVEGLPELSGENSKDRTEGKPGKSVEKIANVLISGVDDIDCDNYLTDNGIRHLAVAGRKFDSVMRVVLTDYRWLRRKAERRSILSAAGDYALAVSKETKYGEKKDVAEVEESTESEASNPDEMTGYNTIRDMLERIPYEAASGGRSSLCKNDACPVHKDSAEKRPDSGLAHQIIWRLGFKYSTSIPKGITKSRKPGPGSLEMRTSIRELGRAMLNCFGKCYGYGLDSVEGSKNTVVGELLWSVEKHTIGPWLRPLTDHFGRTGSESERVIPAGSLVNSVTLSRDEKYVYSGVYDGTILKHDIRSGKCVADKSFSDRQGHVTSVALVREMGSSSGELIAAGTSKGTLGIWNTSSMEFCAFLEGHSRWVNSLAVSEDGNRLISGSYDKTARVWERGEGGSWTLQAVLEHVEDVNSVALSRNGRRIASSCGCQMICLWEEVDQSSSSSGKRSFRRLRSCPLQEEEAYCIIFASTDKNAEVICCGGKEKILVWDLELQEVLHVISLTPEGTPDVAQARCVTKIAASHSSWGAIIVGGCDDFAIRIWRLKDGELLHKFCGHIHLIESLAITRDGRRIISGSDDGTIRVWSLWGSQSQELKPRASVQEFKLGDMLTDVAVAVDGGTVVTVHNYKQIRMWKPESGLRVLVEKNCDMEYGKCHGIVGIGTDGKTVGAVYEDGRILCWDAISSEQKSEVKSNMEHLHYSTTVFSRNMRFLALGNNSVTEVEVWDLEAGEVLVKKKSDFEGSLSPKEELASYVEAEGLEEEANPPRRLDFRVPSRGEEYYIPGLFVEVSGSIVRRSCRNRCGSVSVHACSCTTSAILESAIIDRLVFLPYLREFDTTAGVGTSAVGMLAVKYFTRSIELFAIVK